MNKTTAKTILGDSLQPNGEIYNLGHYMYWNPTKAKITLDCQFSLEELEAIVWVMKKYGGSE